MESTGLALRESVTLRGSHLRRTVRLYSLISIDPRAIECLGLVILGRGAIFHLSRTIPRVVFVHDKDMLGLLFSTEGFTIGDCG